MADEVEQLMSRLVQMNGSVDELEHVLQPLLSKPLSETLTSLDQVQRAKLQVLVPYVVHDLIFVYLKAKGINPKEHGVVAELERIKEYFSKIKVATDPEKRRLAVDTAAATRFIKHAIGKSGLIDEAQADADDNAGPSIPKAIHLRFTEPEPVPEQEPSETQQSREISQSNEGQDDAEVLGPNSEAIDKEVKGAVDKKRRRPAIDPFSGYDHQPSKSRNKGSKRKKQSSSG